MKPLPDINPCCHTPSCDCRGKAFSECFALSAITRILVCSRVSALCVLFTLLSLTPKNASAYWPVRIEDDFYVSGRLDTNDWKTSSIPYPNGSILTVFSVNDYGNSYQIIDKYGELKYDQPQLVHPNFAGLYSLSPSLISDGQNGAITVFKAAYYTPPGIYAQRLDSLGNRMWGDSGVIVFPFAEPSIDICSDGNGGVFVAVSPDEGTLDYTDLLVQHLDDSGNQLFGPSGMVLSGLPNHSERHPKIATDGNGGAIVIWEDHRPPYSTFGAVFAQRIDHNGNTLWSSDLFICEDDWNHNMIADGEGGVIIEANSGGSDFNTHWRVDGEGNILWERDHLSWYPSFTDGIGMVLGEPGYFYLFFRYFIEPADRGFYAQRVDLDGNPHWPSWPDNYGLTVSTHDNSNFTPDKNYVCNFVDDRLAAAYFYGDFFMERVLVYFNAVDTSGNVLYGETGVLADTTHGMLFGLDVVQYEDDGIGLVYNRGLSGSAGTFDILAVRMNAGGALGGPNVPIEDVTIAASGNNLILSWPVMADSASYYVYKSFQPYAFPEEPLAEVTDTTFIDEGAVNEGAGYYNVRWEVR